MYDYTLFNSETLGLEVQNLWNQYNLDRNQVMRQCMQIFSMGVVFLISKFFSR